VTPHTDSPWLVDRDQIVIGGRWTEAHGTETVLVRNPATRSPVAQVRLGDEKDMDSAVAAARESFDAGVWSRADPAHRASVLARAADLLETWAPELATAITTELGCPIGFSRRAHVPNPIRHLRYYAELAGSFGYDEWRTDGTNTSVVTQEPVGVVAAITPWNGPLSTPSLKVAPALAAGCSVVLKPSPETPLTVYALAEAMARAGLPDGVFSIVPGGRQAGAYLVGHPEVDKIAFTGSTAAGKSIMATAAARIARVTLELGGKSAAVILQDADLDVVVPALLPMALLVNGQACIAQTRLLVPRAREREAIEALAEALRRERLGDPMDPATTIGPLISEGQHRRVTGYIDAGRAEGATVVVGGDRPVLPPEIAGGWFVPPTLLAGVRNDMRVAREEIFGPVLAVIPYDGDEHAVALANDSPYGLSGSVWGSDTAHCLAVARRMRTGMVSVNGRPQAYGTPFGGFKQSGLGREMGPEGFRAYLEPKSIAVAG
jgi:aldehyde dehydrogenase (NAD+)